MAKIKPKLKKQSGASESNPNTTAPVVKAKVRTKAQRDATAVVEGAVPMSFDYDGPSGLVINNKSRTGIDMTRFNANAMARVTRRDASFYRGLRNQVGVGGQFLRSNLDAGALRRLIERGYVEPLSADDTSSVDPAARFRLVDKALPERIRG